MHIPACTDCWMDRGGLTWASRDEWSDHTGLSTILHCSPTPEPPHGLSDVDKETQPTDHHTCQLYRISNKCTLNYKNYAFAVWKQMLQTRSPSTMSQFVPHERRFVTEKSKAAIRWAPLAHCPTITTSAHRLCYLKVCLFVCLSVSSAFQNGEKSQISHIKALEQ